MLDEVTPIRFDRFMNSGKTKPSLMACQRASSEEVEVVVKFSAKCERKVTALAMEALVACLAIDLGLNASEPFLVRMDRAFWEHIPDQEFKDIAQKSSPVAFGSKKSPNGFTTWASADRLTKNSYETAAEIFAFDLFTLNPDRRPENPNCLFDGKSIVPLDHELCFTHLLGWKPPWEIGSLSPQSKDVHGHLFFPILRGKNISLDRFQSAWTSKITDERLAEYARAIPEEWGEASDKVCETIKEIQNQRDNIGASISEVRRVLS